MSYQSPLQSKESPFKFFGALASTATGVIGMIGAGKRKREAEAKEKE
mgnify:FL=1